MRGHSARTYGELRCKLARWKPLSPGLRFAHISSEYEKENEGIDRETVTDSSRGSRERTHGSQSTNQNRPRRRSQIVRANCLRPPSGSICAGFCPFSVGALRDLRLPSEMPSASKNMRKAPGSATCPAAYASRLTNCETVPRVAIHAFLP